MNAVFLDVNGVLNYPRCAEVYHGAPGVTDEGLDRLARIVFSCVNPAAVVLTSVWKQLWDNPPLNSNTLDPAASYLFEKLKSRGMHLTDRTQEKNLMDRGMGIKGWMRKVGGVDGWVVLDDEVFPDYEKYGIVPNLVRTDRNAGLTDKDVELAIRILNGK